MKRRKSSGILFYIGFMLVLIVGVLVFEKCYEPGNTVDYSAYYRFVEEGKVSAARILQNEEVPTGRVLFSLEGAGDVSYAVTVSDVNAERERLLEKGVSLNLQDVPGEDIFLTTLLPVILLIVGFTFVILLMGGRLGPQGGGGGGPQMMDFTKNRAKRTNAEENRFRFKDVAGLDEEKEELAEVVDFLKNPEKYTALGARIPKGMLLVGPPGTGKTLLAKAVAGEAGVPFFTISGSDFVEMFVGVGASRVRDMFAAAKKSAPCIIFIDEIDAVGRIRGSGMGGSHDEREQTLNQILVEMDGFSINEGVIVMAATNRADILDPAILRPGRFDRKVSVGRPDVRGREEILQVHARNKKLGDDVDLKTVARTTAGFSGADLENLLNEAAIMAAKDNRPFIRQADIDQAFIKVGIGQEKRSKVVSEKEKRITAYHEMGHAILFEALPDVGPVHTVSIIPTGLGAAGYTMPLPEKDEQFNTKGRMLQDIMVSMGGRIAEELTFDDVTTGASQDIKQATETARAMVMKYGMSEKIGFINYEQQQNEVFLGRDLGHIKTYGTEVYNEIEAEVKSIIDDCYARARRIILDRKDLLDKGAALLMTEEKIGMEAFRALYYGENAAE